MTRRLLWSAVALLLVSAAVLVALKSFLPLRLSEMEARVRAVDFSRKGVIVSPSTLLASVWFQRKSPWLSAHTSTAPRPTLLPERSSSLLGRPSRETATAPTSEDW